MECCLQILCDIPRQDLLNVQYPALQEPFIDLGKDEANIPSLATVAREAPYQVPAALDLVHLEAIVASKRTASEDHIWALREDPNYLAHCVAEVKEHRPEQTLDSNGNTHPSLKEPFHPSFWNRVLYDTITAAYYNLILWDNIHSRLSHLIMLQNRYKDDIVPFKDLPGEYFQSLKDFYYLLTKLYTGPLDTFRRILPGSAPFRSVFVRDIQQPDTEHVAFGLDIFRDSNVIKERLLWVYTTLCDDDEVTMLGMYNLLDELQRLIQSEPEAKRLISPLTVSWIFDLSLMAECMHRIENYCPWGFAIQSGGAACDSSVVQRFNMFHESLIVVIDKAFRQKNLASLGTPLNNRSYYPVDKRRTREATMAMRSAEASLDRFWEAIDRVLINTSKAAQGTIRGLFTRGRILQRTPKWIEPTKQNPKSSNDIGSLGKHLSELYLDLEQRTESTISGQSAPNAKCKSKAKTRGPSHSVEPQVNQPLGCPPSSSASSCIPVDRRALKTFSTLFRVPSMSFQPGEVAWNDFLHALACAGLSPQKLYSSVWQFTPKEGRSI